MTSAHGSYSSRRHLSLVGTESLKDAYRKVYAAIDKKQSTWVSPSDINLLNDRDKVALAAIEIRDAGSANVALNYRGSRLAGLAIECAYIYPQIGSARLMFTVHYFRDAPTNVWSATLKHGPLYLGVTAKGAVSYTKAHMRVRQRRTKNSPT